MKCDGIRSYEEHNRKPIGLFLLSIGLFGTSIELFLLSIELFGGSIDLFSHSIELFLFRTILSKNQPLKV
jgi:hypothetical protein